MQSKDFNKGLATGLLIAGIAFEKTGNSGGGGEFPDGKGLSIVDCDEYRGELGSGVAYLNPDTFSVVFSTDAYYVPLTGGMVLIGSFNLMDWDDWSGEKAEAIVRLIVDGETVFEGDAYEYFDVPYSQRLPYSKTFTYKQSFSFEAKRTNMTNSMALEIYKTFILISQKQIE